MNLPPPTDPLWSEIVTGRRKVAFEFLGARMLVTRLQIAAIKDKNPAVLGQLAGELQGLFAANINLPAARNDLKKLGF
ncbi:MAG: hypothetical protein HY898_15560 [Deltaproteobacteria bacterium]|nr:hypothetical protein [Deltaproteobacteria bacterium]